MVKNCYNNSFEATSQYIDNSFIVGNKIESIGELSLWVDGKAVDNQALSSKYMIKRGQDFF